MPQHTVAIHQVHAILQGPRRLGLDESGILRRADIDPELLRSPFSRVSRNQYAALMRTIKRLLRDEFWGQAERPMLPGSFAMLCARLIQCPDLGTALRVGLDTMRLMFREIQGRMFVSGDEVCVRVQRRAGSLGLEYDFAVGTYIFEAWQLLSWLAGRRVNTRMVCFEHQRQLQGPNQPPVLGGVVRYRQPYSCLILDASILEWPVVQNARGLAEFTSKLPDNLVLRYRSEARLEECVRQRIKPHLGSGLPSLEVCAAELGMGAQTLRRRLREQGRGYQDICNALRRDAAIEYLRRRDLPLDAIGSMLGFSEISAFHRAFKRWTGVSPGAYRRSHLS